MLQLFSYTRACLFDKGAEEDAAPRPMYFNWQVGTTRVIDMMLDIAKDESAKAKQQEE